MNEKLASYLPRSDFQKSLLAGGFVVLGFAAYYLLAGENPLVRTGALLVGLGLGGLVAATASWGLNLLDFTQETRNEVRRVVWPTRQETLQVTLAVLAMVIIAALFLWGVDAVFFYVVRLITG